jgi:hypothetical protein
VIRLADRLDSLTHETRGSHSHHQVLAALLRQQQASTRPQGVDIVTVLGLFLEGSAVRLRSGNIAIVIEQSPSGEMGRPIVKVVVAENGESIDGPQLDLGQVREESIVAVVPLESLPINPVVYFRHDR